MCKICEEWKSKKIDNKKALELVGQKMYDVASESESSHLLSLVDKILDKEVPVSPVNKEVEKTFWEQTHRHDDED